MSGDIAELGFKANSDPLERVVTLLEELVVASRKTDGATEKFNRNMDKSTAATTRFERALERVGTSIGRFIGGNLRQLALGFGTVFAAGALVTRLYQTADALDAVSKAARATGSSIESMQGLATAADLAGLSADYVAGASRRMNRVLGTAISQGKGMTGVFKELGISAQTLAGLPVDERFAMIGDRMRDMNLDASQTTAILTQLGDRGGQLINLLGEGGEEIRKAAKDVQEFNLAVTDVEGQNIEAMNDNWTRLGYAVQGAFNNFIAFVAPTLSNIFLGLAKGVAFLVKNIGWVGDVIKWVGQQFLNYFVPLFIPNLKAITDNFGVMSNTIIRVMMTAFATVEDIWNNFPSVMGSAIIGAVNAMINGINQMIGVARDGINTLINSIPEQLRFGVGPIDSGVGKIGEIADPFATKNAETAKAYQAKLKEIWETDYVGKIGASWTEASAEVDKASDSVTRFSETAGGDGTAGAKKLEEAFKKLTAQGKAAQEKLDALRDTVKDTVGGAFKSFFSDLIQGKSAVDALTGALGNLADKMMNMVLDNAISGILGGLMGGNIGSAFTGGWGSSAFRNAKGNVFDGSGIVNKPTLFPFAQGTGLMGEAGPEAIMPLKRGAGGALGVMVAGNDNRGGAAMAGLQVNVYNENSNDNNVSVSQNNDGSLDIMISKKIGAELRRSGSPANKAVKETFGLRTSVASR